MAASLGRGVVRFSTLLSGLKNLGIKSHQGQINRLPPLQCYSQHEASSKGLMDFFEEKLNWGETSVKVGRPWKKDELRIKSNTDLHKLWYVLLRERNMVMTMEAEYQRNSELFPAPERLEKVEESMENILDIVRERNEAYEYLEKGEADGPTKVWYQNILGVGSFRWTKEQRMPKHLNPNWKYNNRFRGWTKQKYLALFREKRLQALSKYKIRLYKKTEELKKAFPDAADQIQKDYEEELKELDASEKRIASALPSENTFKNE